MARYPMTVVGERQLREELEHLKRVERPSIINAIAEARAHGDLRENAEYHSAREQQSFLEGRISNIEEKLANSQVIDITKITNNGRIVFASTVTLLQVGSNEEIIYQLVGDDESDLSKGKISLNSPLARLLIGKEEGDVVFLNTKSGQIEYEVLTVEYK